MIFTGLRRTGKSTFLLHHAIQSGKKVLYFSADNPCLTALNLYDVIDVAMANPGNMFYLIPIAFLAFAALTKSAQFPFSGWLLGAMVAPTPSSALLHSATMVKAGVYLLIRISPAMADNYVGNMVALVGGFTFLVASCLAISVSDGKKVLAYSTISNLGLIVACTGCGYEETIWAAVFLVIFHAVSKSMLFQCVGAIENTTGSRDVEDMQGLFSIFPKLAVILMIGIAGMFLAPFGMLISKWAALKAFIDAQSPLVSTLMVLFICFGSATTMFYWTKWMAKILGQAGKEKTRDLTKPNEYVSMFFHAVLVVALILGFPWLSQHVLKPLTSMIYGEANQVISYQNITIMIILLVLVKFMGASGGGAQRWIAIGPFTLQPSELAKIILIVVFANFLAKFKDKINTPGIIAMSLLIAGVPLVLVYVQPDLSTTIVIFAMFACILFTSGISWKLVGGVFAAILPVAVIGIYLLFQPNISIIKTYQLNRIRAFYNIQVSDGDATDYSSLMEQQNNAVIAIGSGGLWGKGLYDDSADSLTNADYLYEPHTDFIFAVIGEKLGFVGCSVVIITLLVIIIYCFRVGAHAPDFAGRVIGCGMGSILGLQTFINLAVTTRMIPNTGLTLPFISYGLSSLVSLCIGIGLVMNVSIQQKGIFD